MYKELLNSNGITNFGRMMDDRSSEYISLLPIRPSAILEIGRDEGHSTGFFRYLYPESTLITVDIVHKPQVDKIINIFPNADKVTILDGDSNLIHNYNYIFDLVLIDGDHSYEGALLDWNNIQSHIHDKTIIIFDDVDRLDECGKVFHQDISGNEYFKITLLNEDNKPLIGLVVKR